LANPEVAHELLVWTGVGLFVVAIATLVWMALFQRRLLGLAKEQGSDMFQRFPLGLPPGTVRSLLALSIVGVGLWLFVVGSATSQWFAPPPALTGIIGMVLGFYFGTRASGTDELKDAYQQVVNAASTVTDAQKQIVDSKNDVVQAKSDLAAAKDEFEQQTQGIKADAADKVSAVTQELDCTKAKAAELASTANSFAVDSSLEKLRRHLTLAQALATDIAPLLPAQLLGTSSLAKLNAAVNSAQSLIDTAVKNPGQRPPQAIDNEIANLTDPAKGSGALFVELLKAAAPFVGSAAMAIGGPLPAIAMLLSLGARLGSDGYQRWRARVLAAPVSSSLVPFGTVTPMDAEEALSKSPTFEQALMQQKSVPGFDNGLVEAALRDDGADILWSRYGPNGKDAKNCFTDLDTLKRGLDEFRQALLGLRARSDVTDQVLAGIASTLAGAQSGQLRPKTATPAVVDSLVQAANDAELCAADPSASAVSRAAFEALILLVGVARQQQIDLPKVLSELTL
jgi:hypothetical protein